MSNTEIIEEMQQLEAWWNTNIKLKIEQGMSPEQAYDAVCESVDFAQLQDDGQNISGRVVHRNFKGFQNPNGNSKSPTNE